MEKTKLSNPGPQFKKKVNSNLCIVCNYPGCNYWKYKESPDSIAAEAECNRCRTYRFDASLSQGTKFPETENDKNRLQRYIARQNIFHKNIPEFNRINIEDVLHSIPTILNAFDSYIECLSAIKQMAPKLGTFWRTELEILTGLCGTENEIATNHLLDKAKSSGLIFDRGSEFGLTLDGFDWIDKHTGIHSNSKIAFIAIWFNDKMKIISDNIIEPLLIQCGYNPIRVDKDVSSSRIDERIVAIIKSSGLVIADFTGGRGGVYYEAGLAEGLGIPVIHMCNSSWETQIGSEKTTWSKLLHFDTRQLPHIFWENEKDLREKLINRIFARGLNKNQKLEISDILK